MSINLTDELLAKTKKGKIASAKQVFLEGDQENLQQIGDKTHQLEDAIKDITVTGGASTANAVSYNNETSGMTAVTAQGAIDELAAKNTLQDAEISKKANSADVTSQMQKEQKRVNTELGKKFDKESILQESGEAEDKVMSQKAVSTKLSDFAEQINDIVTRRDNLYHITQNENYLLAIVDKADNFLGGITKSGRWIIPDGISDEARKHVNIIYDVLKKHRADIDAEVGERTSIIRRGNSSYEWAIADKIGNVWIAGTKDGKVVIPSGIPDEVKPLLDDAFKRIERLERFIKTADAGGILAALVDANMNELLSVDKEGIFSILNKLKTQSGMSIETVDTINNK